MIVKMLLADAAIGDEQALPPKSQPDALGDAGERRGKRRPDGTVEDPERAQALPAQQRDEPDQIDAALQFRPEMLKIKRRCDGWLGLEQFARAACRRYEECHLAAGRGGRDGPDERQVPDDVANARLDLDDCARRHIDCRSKGCDMAFVMHLNN
jgi:hypothetical protein